MLADLRVLDRGAELLVDTERPALQDLFTVLHRHRIGYAVELHKRTLERGLISLLGPRARELAECRALPLEEHANASHELAGRPVVLVATDLGIDVICEAADTGALLAELRERGAVDVSEATAECRRIERGRPRYGVDLDESVIPQEAGLNERAVSFTKGCYVGQETVARLFYKGKPNRHLRGLRLDRPVAPGSAILLGERDVGRVSSVAESPRFGAIGLALVRREAAVGDAVTVGAESVAARVEALPFA
jgi:folate-binding protein YgfZ